MNRQVPNNLTESSSQKLHPRYFPPSPRQCSGTPPTKQKTYLKLCESFKMVRLRTRGHNKRLGTLWQLLEGTPLNIGEGVSKQPEREPECGTTQREWVQNPRLWIAVLCPTPTRNPRIPQMPNGQGKKRIGILFRLVDLKGNPSQKKGEKEATHWATGITLVAVNHAAESFLVVGLLENI